MIVRARSPTGSPQVAPRNLVEVSTYSLDISKVKNVSNILTTKVRIKQELTLHKQLIIEPSILLEDHSSTIRKTFLSLNTALRKSKQKKCIFNQS